MARPKPISRLFHLFFLWKRPMTLGVRAIVENKEGEVLLVRHTYVKGWYLPGGGVEKGQSVSEALAMELREEANIHHPGTVKMLSVFFNRSASSRDHVVLFHCVDWQMETMKTPDREIAEAKFFSLDALPQGTTEATHRRLDEYFYRKPMPANW